MIKIITERSMIQDVRQLWQAHKRWYPSKKKWEDINKQLHALDLDTATKEGIQVIVGMNLINAWCENCEFPEFPLVEIGVEIEYENLTSGCDEERLPQSAWILRT